MNTGIAPVKSLYVHVPFCVHHCDFCDFFKYRHDRWDDFHHYLSMQVCELRKLLARTHSKVAPLETIYLGGGTPSLWKNGANILQELVLTPLQLSIASGAEFSVEIDPSGWSEEGIHGWRKIGANRFSVGLQTLNPQVFAHIDRGHEFKETYRLIEFMSSQGLNWSADFMLGLSPHQRDLATEFDEVISAGAKHVSTYLLTPPEGYIREVASEEGYEQEYLLASRVLAERGFQKYEVSNYACAGFESRHNIGYWSHDSMLALGPSGVGFLRTSSGAIRFRGKVGSSTYGLEELTPRELDLERLYMQLRMGEKRDYRSRISPKILESWLIRGLAIGAADELKLNDTGHLALDGLMGEVFAHMTSANK